MQYKPIKVSKRESFDIQPVISINEEDEFTVEEKKRLAAMEGAKRMKSNLATRLNQLKENMRKKMEMESSNKRTMD